MNLVAALTLLQGTLLVVTFLVCALLILVILLQKGRGGGLAGAFGGGGGSGGAFGAKTGDVFTLVTVVLAFVFLALNVVGNWVVVPDTGQKAVAKQTASPGSPLPPGDEGEAPATAPAQPVGDEATPPPEDAAPEAVPPPPPPAEQTTPAPEPPKEGSP